MEATGGCRKVRVAGRGKGKSGGYRIITFFTGRNALAKLTKTLADTHAGKAVKMENRNDEKRIRKIAAGLEEATTVARGETGKTRFHVASEIDVKAIRRKTGLSQADFAYRFGFTRDQIKAWEQNRSRPLGGVRDYLMIIGTGHETVETVFEQAKRPKAA